MRKFHFVLQLHQCWFDKSNLKIHNLPSSNPTAFSLCPTNPKDPVIVSIMPFPPQITFLISSILFARLFPCFHFHIDCDDPSIIRYGDPPVPADCRFLLTQLPLFQANVTQDMASPDARTSDAVPFYPYLNIIHGSCTIDVDLDLDYRPDTRSATTNIKKGQLFEAWTAISEGSASIIQSCVDIQHTIGSGTGFLENDDLTYRIEIGEAGPYEQFDAQKQAMSRYQFWDAGFQMSDAAVTMY